MRNNRYIYIKRYLIFFLCFLFLSSLHFLFSEENIIPNSGFEDWEWAPIHISMSRRGRELLSRGMKLSFEYRGPLYRRPVGFALEAGIMIEGEDAYEGRSLLLDNSDSKNETYHLVVGRHGPYNNLFKTKKTYNYEICLKGNGIFTFTATVYGIPSSGGESRVIGSCDLIKIKVTEKWERYTGSFTIPEYHGYEIEEPVPAAIVIPPGSKIYIDNFIVR